MASMDLLSVKPEIFLLVADCVILLVDLFVKSRQRTLTYVLTALTLVVVALICGQQALALMAAPPGEQVIIGFGGMVVVDVMASWLKCFAAVAVLVAIVYSRHYAAERNMLRGGELFSLSVCALMGTFVLLSAGNFVLLYLGLELLTLSSYALVALRRDSYGSVEAAMKYFFLGALASGFLLYGISMIYGATGSLDLDTVRQTAQSILAGELPRKNILILGLVFIVAGLGFKFGVVPFHSWAPDVYHGAPTAMAMMIAAAPKIAAFGLMIRLLSDGLSPMIADWQQMLGVMAVLSLLVGNLAAIAQTNIKRMLAFSTIAQMGFLLLGMVAANAGGGAEGAPEAFSASMFYALTYVLTTLATFGVLLMISSSDMEYDKISDLAGLSQTRPLYALVMAACMFSLAGIPPLVGFFAKLSILQPLLATGDTVYLLLAVFAVLMSLVGAFYYLRVVKVMYFDAPSTVVYADGIGPVMTAPIHARVLLVVNGALVLLLGMMPAGLMRLCEQAIDNLLFAL